MKIIYQDKLVLEGEFNGKRFRQGKRVSKDCPLDFTTRRIYVRYGLVRAVKHVWLSEEYPEIRCIREAEDLVDRARGRRVRAHEQAITSEITSQALEAGEEDVQISTEKSTVVVRGHDSGRDTGRASAQAHGNSSASAEINERRSAKMNRTESTAGANLRIQADTLEMWANQIREHCQNQENNLPSPNRIDDWVAEYRSAWFASWAARESQTGVKHAR